MPSELRQIAFRETEFFSAVRDYRQRRGEPLPVGSVLGIDIDEQPDISAKIRIGDDEGDAIETVDLEAESIAAALILFCINRKIPLPAHATKSVKRAGDNIVLTISISMENYQARWTTTKVPDLPSIRAETVPDRRNLN